MWKSVGESQAKREWFNPETRLRISLTGMSFGSWHVFVYVKHRSPCPEGVTRPSFSRFFDSKEKAVKFAVKLMARESLNFNYLRSLNLNETEQVLAWLNKLLEDFMIKKARFKLIRFMGPCWYERDYAGVPVRINARIIAKPDCPLGTIEVLMQRVGARNQLRVLLGFVNQTPLQGWVDQKKWIISQFDDLAKAQVLGVLVRDVAGKLIKGNEGKSRAGECGFGRGWFGESKRHSDAHKYPRFHRVN